jgi:AraC-like DNA-binding protein
MEEWKSQHMSFPYWRLYWNRTSGGYVVYKRKIILEPDQLFLIPPNTPFASEMDPPSTSKSPYSLKGGWIESREMEAEKISEGCMLHLFVHFTLGYPWDMVHPEVYAFPASDKQQELVHSLTSRLIRDGVHFEPVGSMEIYALIFSLLNQLPPDTWQRKTLDARVARGIRYLETHIGRPDIRNAELAREGGMSVNAFARLFREETGYSPRKYLMRMRIEKACDLLHHNDSSIEQVANSCGFSDRYYFTRIFSRTMRLTPVQYRKNSLLMH